VARWELSYCHTILCELCFSFKAMVANEEKRGLLMLVPVSRSSARPSLSNPHSVASCAQAGTSNEPERTAWKGYARAARQLVRGPDRPSMAYRKKLIEFEVKDVL